MRMLLAALAIAGTPAPRVAAAPTRKPPAALTVAVWQPEELQVAVPVAALPALDLGGCPLEVQAAWRARGMDAMATAAVVFERARDRLDAAGWLALGEIRSQRALDAYQARVAHEGAGPPLPPFDPSAALAAYAEAERRDGGGALGAIARYYAAYMIGDWDNWQMTDAGPVPDSQRAKATAMLREVGSSKAPASIRTHALFEAGWLAFTADRWSEAADLLGRGLELARLPPALRGVEALTYLHAVSLYRARRHAEVLAVVEREAAALPAGPDREHMLDLAAAALEALGPGAPRGARARFGPRLEDIRRREGAGDRDDRKVAGAIVARCRRASAEPCRNRHSIFGGPDSCAIVVLEVQTTARGGVRTRTRDTGDARPARDSFLGCLDGPQPAVYGSGLRHPSRFRHTIFVQRD